VSKERPKLEIQGYIFPLLYRRVH